MVTVQLLNWLVWAALIGLNAVAEGEDAGVSSRADLGLGVMSVEGEKTSPESMLTFSSNKGLLLSMQPSATASDLHLP